MPPKPSKTTKAPSQKAATKVVGKGGAKGVKASFAQPRKAPPPRTKPEAMSEAEWSVDKLRRQISSQERSDRRKKAAVKQTDAQRAGAAAAHIVAMSGRTNVPGSQSSSASRHSASPSLGAFFPQDMASQTPLSRFSHGGADWADGGDPHGGWNPNTMFGVPQRPNVDLNRPYAGSPCVPLRRGPLEFSTTPSAGPAAPHYALDGEYEAMVHGGGFVVSEMDDGAAALNELINQGTAGYTQLDAAWQDSQAPEEEEVEAEEEEDEEERLVDEEDDGMAEPGDDEADEEEEEEEEEEVEADEEE